MPHQSNIVTPNLGIVIMYLQCQCTSDSVHSPLPVDFQFEIKEKEKAKAEHPEDVLRAKEEKLQQLIKEFLPPEKP